MVKIGLFDFLHKKCRAEIDSLMNKSGGLENENLELKKNSSEIQTAKYTLEDKILSQSKLLNEKTIEYETAKADLAEKTQKYEVEIQNLKKSNEAEASSLTQKYEAEITALKQQHTSEMSALGKKHDEDFASRSHEFEQDYAQKIKALELQIGRELGQKAISLIGKYYHIYGQLRYKNPSIDIQRPCMRIIAAKLSTLDELKDFIDDLEVCITEGKPAIDELFAFYGEKAQEFSRPIRNAALPDIYKKNNNKKDDFQNR